MVVFSGKTEFGEKNYTGLDLGGIQGAAPEAMKAKDTNSGSWIVIGSVKV